MYFNVNFNVLFKLIKVHLLVSELYMYQNARCNNKNCPPKSFYFATTIHDVPFQKRTMFLITVLST